MTPRVSHLDWPGVFNVRDLGGLPVTGGGRTRPGAVVRADALDHLTAEGWSALHAHGIRTIVDLRNDDELTPDLVPRPADLTTLHLPLDAIEVQDFWKDWMADWRFGTPSYYASHLQRFPERTARVVGAVAGARPGGVLVHCGIGRDRTGMIAMVLLALVGVEPDAIAADYALSAPRLPGLFARRGETDTRVDVGALAAAEGTSTSAMLRDVLEAVDLEPLLARGGLGPAEVAALRSRLLS
jgi:protein tyrosine/serine phosphatase